jgi:Ribonuclease G/E
MKGSMIALGKFRGRKAAAMLVDGHLDDLLIDPKDEALPRPGAIYRARCERPLKGQGGMILRLPGGISGFLRGSRGLAPGQTLLVQVTGRAEEGKAVPLTAKVLFKSRYAIATPEAPGINISRSIRDDEERVRLLEIAHEAAHEGEGLILRSACIGASDDEVAADVCAMLELSRAVWADREGAPELLVEGPDAHELAWRDWPLPDQLDDGDNALEHHDADTLIEAQLGPHERLPGGFHAFIEPTRALVAVDVNTGGDSSHAAGLKANIATARALPRMLRCRGLGGQIVVDFAPMAKKDRRQLEQILRAAFRNDSIETSLVGWTQLGLYELQRKRERMALRLALGDSP